MLINEGQKHEPLCLLTVISDPGKADAMARFALQNGARTAYHFYAHGTVPGHLLAFLGLSSVRREMICLTAPKDLGPEIMDRLCGQFHIGKATNGIAFLQMMDQDDREEAVPCDYVMIAAVVNEGDGEYVVESARRSQPVGATILKAFGTADHSRKTFDFEIIPQKELVLIVARICHVDAIYCAIYHEMRTESPGRGILFCLALDRVAGLLDMPACQPPADITRDVLEPALEEDRVALFAVSDRGHTAPVLATVEQLGGTGATILHCRLAGPESGGWYSRLGDPEKEIVLAITQTAQAEQIRKELLMANQESAQGPFQAGLLKVTRFRKLSKLKDSQ
ncbi:MAG TPA: hypothetical protein PK646_05315 [Bacillota bacterium]|jgi:hypothetical protein|nr:hypothetical protein [Fastidiosipila sp.]HPX93177.1 hypothetical protein [Bacillota bacterium]HQB81490.1 hypothetical protein [Bacillota bacterium]